jgi:hypothetical protein
VVTLACEGADCAAARSGVVSISNAARSSGRPKSRRKRPDPRGGERIGYGGAPPARQRRRRRCRVPAGRSSRGEENVGGGEENEHRAGSGLPRIERPIRALSWSQATGVRMAGVRLRRSYRQ